MHLWWIANMWRCGHRPHRVTLNFSPPLRPKLPAAFSARLVDIEQHVWGAKTCCVPSPQIKVVKSLRFFSFFFLSGRSRCPCLQRIQRRMRRLRRNPSGRNAKFDALLLFYGPIADRVDARPTNHKFSGSAPEHPLAAVALQCQWNLSVVQTCWCFCVFLRVMRADWDIFTCWGQYNVVLVYISF